MSRTEFICCASCGRELYKTFSDTDNDTVKHIDYYILNTVNGEEQICPKCYEANMAEHYEIKDTTMKYRYGRN